MKKKTKFYALLLAMVLSLTQMIGAAVPVKAATKECSHGYTLVNGIGIRMHECGESVCITCYHGHSKRVVIPKTFKLNGKNLPPTQFDSDNGFSENGVKEIVIPDQKPDPQAFKYVENAFALNPEETWYVGDTYEADVVGANTAGWHTIWFNHRNRECPEKNRADITVKSIEELKEVIRGQIG